MISVIVVTCNQEKTISRTLDSILSQKCHQQIEIVIGEDCSTDATPAICRDYANRYPQIRLFCNTYNKGVLNNYFDCLLACQGEYIADCAGDDFWVDDQKLEKSVTLMESNPEITIVHTAWQSYNELTGMATDSPCQPFPAPLTDGKDMLSAIITQTRMPVIHLCTALYRADILLKAYHENTDLFRSQDLACEDIQVAFFLAMNGKVAYLPDVTLYYNQGDETVSFSSDDRKQFRFVQRTTNLSHTLSRIYHIENQEVKLFFRQRSFALLMHAFRAYDKQLRQEAISSLKEWGITPSPVFRVVRLVTSTPLLWRAALYLRKKLR